MVASAVLQADNFPSMSHPRPREVLKVCDDNIYLRTELLAPWIFWDTERRNPASAVMP